MKTNNKKTLLIESSDFIFNKKLSKVLKESLELKDGQANTLIVKNIPCTILNRKNQNGRIYSTNVVTKALVEAQDAMKQRSLLSQADEHPEGSFVAPTHASHVVINAYVKKNVKIKIDKKFERFDVLFMDWLVLNTKEGKDLRALFEAGCSVGTSIRGVGNMEGEYVRDYELLGCDCVGNPSSSTYTRMPVQESVKFEVKPLNETYNVTTTSANTLHNLEAAAELQAKLEDIRYGTVVKTSTKVDQETDPRTGAETSITTLEAETSDDVASLDQALMLAKNAMLNGIVNVDTVTIENIKDIDQKEATENNNAVYEESKLSEAKEKSEKIDSPKEFIIYTDRGYVTIDDNNAIDFTKNPENALHFTSGKEETGIVHLSTIEKILDTMGILDVKKYYKKSIPTECNNIDCNDATITEENGSNTKYLANVETIDDNGLPEIENIPVSATELDSALAEISNLWKMKSKDGEKQVDITLVDTINNEQYSYNTETNALDPEEIIMDDENIEVVEEADEEIKQNDNKLVVDVDDEIEIEKEFDTPLQANLAKKGIEQDKIDPAILLKDSENEIDEKLYHNVSAPSDPEVTLPLNEKNDKIVKINNIKLDDDFINNIETTISLLRGGEEISLGVDSEAEDIKKAAIDKLNTMLGHDLVKDLDIIEDDTVTEANNIAKVTVELDYDDSIMELSTDEVANLPETLTIDIDLDAISLDNLNMNYLKKLITNEVKQKSEFPVKKVIIKSVN